MERHKRELRETAQRPDDRRESELERGQSEQSSDSLRSTPERLWFHTVHTYRSCNDDLYMLPFMLLQVICQRLSRALTPQTIQYVPAMFSVHRGLDP